MITPDICAGCDEEISPPQDDRVLPIRLASCDFHDYLCVATWATNRNAAHSAAIETHLRSTIDQLVVTAESGSAEVAAANAALPGACQALSDFTGEEVLVPDTEIGDD